jgi:outer membrane murein-binding lipoprotein Lpp
MADELKTLVTDLASTWESELKPRIDQMESERKASGEAHAETKAAVDKVNDRLDAIEALAQKAALAPEKKDGEPSQEREGPDGVHAEGSSSRRVQGPRPA